VHSRRAHDVQILQQAQFRRSVVGTFRKRRNSDLRILGVAAGLPRLPDLEFAIYEKPRPDKAAAGAGRGSADACTGTITPGDLR
jgi:hypothetical protein